MRRSVMDACGSRNWIWSLERREKELVAFTAYRISAGTHVRTQTHTDVAAEGQQLTRHNTPSSVFVYQLYFSPLFSFLK